MQTRPARAEVCQSAKEASWLDFAKESWRSLQLREGARASQLTATAAKAESPRRKQVIQGAAEDWSAGKI